MCMQKYVQFLFEDESPGLMHGMIILGLLWVQWKSICHPLKKVMRKL